MRQLTFASLATAGLTAGGVLLATLAPGGPAFAVGGCVASPEDPTWIFARFRGR